MFTFLFRRKARQKAFDDLYEEARKTLRTEYKIRETPKDLPSQMARIREVWEALGSMLEKQEQFRTLEEVKEELSKVLDAVSRSGK